MQVHTTRTTQINKTLKLSPLFYYRPLDWLLLNKGSAYMNAYMYFSLRQFFFFISVWDNYLRYTHEQMLHCTAHDITHLHQLF